MPHLCLDYSPNLRADGDLDGLCRALAGTLVAQRGADGRQVFPTGAVRVRAFAADSYCIADGRPDAAYVHARLEVGAGRGAETLKAAGDAVFETMKSHFARQYASRGLALSLEVSEFGEGGTWKHNNLHARFRND